MKQSVISRRRFIHLSGAVCSSLMLAACAGKEAAKEAKEVVIVEKDKFPTATPIVETGVRNAFGRELLSDAAAAEDQVLIERETEPAHLDFSRDRFAAHAALNWGAEALLQLDNHSEPVPALAETYTEGPNAEYFDFTLREGAKWSDGTPITAEDLVFTFRHLSDPALGNPWVWYYFGIKGVKARWLGEAGPEDIGVEAVDDRTVRIRGEGPIPHLPQMLGVQGTGPIPKHVAEADPEHWAESVDGYVCNGPFVPTAWERGKSLEWGVNTHYNGPIQPALERVVQLFEEPENGWFWAWKERRLDLLHDLGFANVRAAQTTAVIVQQLRYAYNAGTEYLALDTTKAPLDNVKLRQALAHALDRDTWCSGTMSYTRMPAYAMLPPDFAGYSEELQLHQAFDVDAAKALLTDAGYPDGKATDGKQLELTLAVNADDTYASFLHGDPALMNRNQETAQFIKDQWEENLGIKVDVSMLSEQEWYKGRRDRSLQIYIGFHRPEYRDPASCLGTLWQSIDDSGSLLHPWKNDVFDDLSVKAGQTADQEQRIAAYQAAEKVLAEDVGAVFISHNSIYTMWWPHLTGVHFNVDGLEIYRPDLTRYELYIKNDFAKWRDQAGTTATGERHTPATPVVK